MLIDKINLNHLRIFECVYRRQSMTYAAKELLMSQSGVSQHIKQLENILNAKLFDRIKQKIVPTPSAHELYKNSMKSLDIIESTLQNIFHNGISSQPITIGTYESTPPLFLTKLIIDFQEIYEEFNFKIIDIPKDRGEEYLLKSKIDLLIDDEKIESKDFSITKIFEEKFYLCMGIHLSNSIDTSNQSKDTFLKYPYFINKNQNYVKKWFHHHFLWNNINIRRKVCVPDMQTVAELIIHGKGIGVLSSLFIRQLKHLGHTIKCFKGKKSSLEKQYYFKYLKEKTLPKTVKMFLHYSKQSLKKDDLEN